MICKGHFLYSAKQDPILLSIGNFLYSVKQDPIEQWFQYVTKLYQNPKDIIL
jgi:hypothetical protein